MVPTRSGAASAGIVGASRPWASTSATPAATNLWPGQRVAGDPLGHDSLRSRLAYRVRHPSRPVSALGACSGLAPRRAGRTRGSAGSGGRSPRRRLRRSASAAPGAPAAARRLACVGGLGTSVCGPCSLRAGPNRDCGGSGRRSRPRRGPPRVGARSVARGDGGFAVGSCRSSPVRFGLPLQLNQIGLVRGGQGVREGAGAVAKGAGSAPATLQASPTRGSSGGPEAGREGEGEGAELRLVALRRAGRAAGAGLVVQALHPVAQTSVLTRPR